MRIAAIILVSMLLSCSVVAEKATPDNIAHEFYAWVLKSERNTGFPAATELNQLANFFTPSLLKLIGDAKSMEAQCIKNTPDGEKPYMIEGSILVGNYEGATEVIVGESHKKNKELIVESRLFIIDERYQKSHDYRVHTWTDQLIFIQEGGKWGIGNIMFESKSSLAVLLDEYIESAAMLCNQKSGLLPGSDMK